MSDTKPPTFPTTLSPNAVSHLPNRTLNMEGEQMSPPSKKRRVDKKENVFSPKPELTASSATMGIDYIDLSIHGGGDGLTLLSNYLGAPTSNGINKREPKVERSTSPTKHATPTSNPAFGTLRPKAEQTFSPMEAGSPICTTRGPKLEHNDQHVKTESPLARASPASTWRQSVVDLRDEPEASKARIKSQPKDKARRMSLDDDAEYDREAEEINNAFLSLSHFPDVDAERTDWIDELIYSRPSATEAARGLAAQQTTRKLTEKELAEYMSSIENRPGHVRRSRRLIQAKNLRRAPSATDSTSPETAETAMEIRNPHIKAEEPVDITSDDETHEDPVLERERVTEAALKLRCRRRRKWVTHRERIQDDGAAPADGETRAESHTHAARSGRDTKQGPVESSGEGRGSEVKPSVSSTGALKAEEERTDFSAGVKEDPSDSSAAGLETKPKLPDLTKPPSETTLEGSASNVNDTDDSHIVLGQGPQGEPVRYKVTRELRDFWTVRGMTTSLLDHQIIGVDWMLEKELSEQKPRGGLVADMMGMGKTMQVIATMVLNRPPADAGLRIPKPTLIIAPTALLQQWASEINHHTVEGAFNVFIHHGSSKIKNLNHLKSLDVVITSYHTIMLSHPSPKRPKQGMSKAEVEAWWEQKWETRKEFHRMKFYRVVCDESQYIKNSRTRMSAACTSLRAVYKWSVSGTPIQNSLMDMYPQFRFLEHPHFSDLPAFKNVFGTNLSGGAARAAKAMQVELTKIMMRRTKEDRLCGRKLLDLTPKIVDIKEVDFSKEERQLYTVIEKKSIDKINSLRRTCQGENNFYLCVLAMLTRLRQICNHPSLVLKALKRDFRPEELKIALDQSDELLAAEEEHGPGDEGPSTVTGAFGVPRRRPKNMRETKGGVRQMLAFAEEHDVEEESPCPLCSEALEDPVVIRQCKHVFCQDCVTSYLEETAVDNGQSRCPVCSQYFVAESDLKAVPPLTVATPALPAPALPTNLLHPSKSNASDRHWLDWASALMPSAKMMALRDQLRKYREERPDDKIIIFSQFASSREPPPFDFC